MSRDYSALFEGGLRKIELWQSKRNDPPYGGPEHSLVLRTAVQKLATEVA